MQIKRYSIISSFFREEQKMKGNEVRDDMY